MTGKCFSFIKRHSEWSSVKFNTNIRRNVVQITAASILGIIR